MSRKFIVYCRKSSEGEGRQSASISDQESVLHGIEEKEGLRIVGRLRESKSAKEPDIRPVYRSMIDRIKAGEANSILCWHLNRLVRNEKEDGEMRWLLRTGVIQCIKTPEREYLPEDHALLIAVESSMASQYVRDLKRDVERGAREKAEKGWYPFRAKQGYVVEPLSKELLNDATRFPLLQRAWQQLLTGSYSVPQVLMSLNRAGYRTPRTSNGGNKPMNRASLYRIFNDPFYAGSFTYGGVTRVGKHQPMISQGEFAKVQRILGNKGHHKQEKFFHAYAGLIRCGVCGCLITAETHIKHYKGTDRTRRYTYYHCTGMKGCRKLSVSDTDLDGSILAQLESCRLDAGFADWALETLAREKTENRALCDVKKDQRPVSTGLFKKRLDAVWALFEDGDITRAEFLERKQEYEQAIEDMRAASLAEQLNADRVEDNVRKVLTFHRDAYDRFMKKGPQGKRSVAFAFARNYLLTQGNLTFEPYPGLDRLRTFEPQKNRENQVGPDVPGSQNPYWRAVLDEILQIVAASDVELPELSEDETLDDFAAVKSVRTVPSADSSHTRFNAESRQVCKLHP